MGLFIGFEGGSQGGVLRLEGRLTREGVAELERVTRAPDWVKRIDLGQLYSADEAGISALRRLAAEGVELVGTRPLIEYRLHEEAMGIPNETRAAARTTRPRKGSISIVKPARDKNNDGG